MQWKKGKNITSIYPMFFDKAQELFEEIRAQY